MNLKYWSNCNKLSKDSFLIKLSTLFVFSLFAIKIDVIAQDNTFSKFQEIENYYQKIMCYNELGQKVDTLSETYKVWYYMRSQINDPEKYVLFDFEEYVKYFKVKANLGDAIAQNALGSMYFNGWGVAIDKEISFQWELKAALNGLPEAQYTLSGCYYYGHGVPINYRKGFLWMKKAAEQGYPIAQVWLAWWYDSGDENIGIKQNKQEAFKWYLKAAKQEDVTAMMRISEYYLEGNYFIHQNVSKAIEWLEKAGNLDYSEPFRKIASIYDDGVYVERDMGKAITYYKKAAELDNVDSYFRLGEIYKNGDGVKKNIEETIKWYHKAMESKYYWFRREAQFRLGCLYFNGEGLPKDYNRAFILFEEASKSEPGLISVLPQHHSEIENMMGVCYENGYGVTMDLQKAISWYEIAIKSGNASAMANLGYFYEYGISVRRDESRAFELYKESAENGNAYGQRRLAFAYYYGIGTPQNGDKAIYWMSMAKDNGDEVATANLDNMISLVNNDKRINIDNTTVTIFMDKRNTLYYVPCKINGIKADFIFDTGASAISLSSDFAMILIDLGLLSADDVIGEASTIIADGSSNDVLIVIIKDVEIGGLHLNNVKAVIKDQQNAPLLLGQSAIEKLGKITIDGCKLTIHKKL